jgi:hypothetical protein
VHSEHTQAPSQGLRKHGRSVLLRQIGFALHNSNHKQHDTSNSCDSSVAGGSHTASSVHDDSVHSTHTEQHSQRKSSGALTPAKRVRLSSLDRDDTANHSAVSNNSSTAAAATDGAAVHRHSAGRRYVQCITTYSPSSHVHPIVRVMLCVL